MVGKTKKLTSLDIWVRPRYHPEALKSKASAKDLYLTLHLGSHGTFSPLAIFQMPLKTPFFRGIHDVHRFRLSLFGKYDFALVCWQCGQSDALMWLLLYMNIYDLFMELWKYRKTLAIQKANILKLFMNQSCQGLELLLHPCQYIIVYLSSVYIYVCILVQM